jgi:hypothetical protein
MLSHVVAAQLGIISSFDRSKDRGSFDLTGKTSWPAGDSAPQPASDADTQDGSSLLLDQVRFRRAKSPERGPLSTPLLIVSSSKLSL